MEKVDVEKKKKVDVHYVDSGDSCFIEENFNDYYLEHGDLHFSEFLQIQESLYRSLPKSVSNGRENVPSFSDSKTDSEHAREDKSSLIDDSIKLQLTLDETVARSLQELENHMSRTSLNGTAIAVVPTATTSASTSMSLQSAGQDDIDPDNMTFEELQSLGESIGTENKGLSDEIISFLPSSTYKTGLFSKKDKHNCVICYMPYKNRDALITLPCHHHYHSSCISRWLKINKACPVCNDEVFGS